MTPSSAAPDRDVSGRGRPAPARAAEASMREAEAALAAVRAGDQDGFVALAYRHHRELHVHCYRMLASYDDAEDIVQEVLLRAWRRRESFTEGVSFRAWLYRIATNACIDAIRSRKRRLPAGGGFAEVTWLQPYPDRLLDEVAPGDEPDAVVVTRETIELAFLAALQLLPGRQRAVLLARDVLGWSAADVAELLDASVASVNSALQRARATLQRELPERRQDWSVTSTTDEERELLARFIEAHERHDAKAAAAMLRDDIRISMPPHDMVFEGIGVVARALETAFGVEEVGDWRLVPTSANRMPAAASYLRPWGGTEFRAFKLDVVQVVEGKVRAVTTFGWSRFEDFGLPLVLDDAG
jgi:RNA polymerase sigma-70 factor (TIGR02960 family)